PCGCPYRAQKERWRVMPTLLNAKRFVSQPRSPVAPGSSDPRVGGAFGGYAEPAVRPAKGRTPFGRPGGRPARWLCPHNDRYTAGHQPMGPKRNGILSEITWSTQRSA